MAISGETIKTINSLHYEDNKEEQRIEETLHASLKEANLIKEKVKEPELKKKFQQEYNELENTILESVNNDLQISYKERMSIMLELSDVITLAEEHDISTDFRKRDSFWWVFSWVSESDVKWVENEAKNLRNKDISEYSIDEAQVILEHLNKEYWDFEEWNFAWTDEENISDLADKKDINVYQDRLIAKILWTEEKWFNNEYLKWYNNKEWNYLISIEKFEANILDPKIKISDINFNELWNYFWYLENKWWLSQDNLLNLFWKDKINEIKDIINGNSKDFIDTIWESRGLNSLLEEYNISSILEKMVSSNLNNVSESLNNLSNINYNDLPIEILKQNPEVLLQITNPKIIIQLLNEWIKMNPLHLHDSVIYTPEIIPHLNISEEFINRFNGDKLLRSPGLMQALINHKESWIWNLNFIVQKFKEDIIEYDFIREHIKSLISDTAKYWLATHTSEILYQTWITENLNLHDILSKDSIDTSKLNTFLATHKIDEYEDTLIDYIKNWWEIVDGLYLNMFNENIIKQVLMTNNGIKVAHLIPNEVYQNNPYLFKIAVKNIGIENMKNFIESVEIPNIETLLFTIQEISNKDSDNKHEIFSNPIFKQRSINILNNNRDKNFNITQTQEKILNKLTDYLNENNKNLEELKSKKTEIANYISTLESDKKINILESNLLTTFQEKWIDITQGDLQEIFTLLSNTDYASNKLLLDKINNLDWKNSKFILDKILNIQNLKLSEEIKKLKNIENKNLSLSPDVLIQRYDAEMKYLNQSINIEQFVKDAWYLPVNQPAMIEMLTKYQEKKELVAKNLTLEKTNSQDDDGNLIIPNEEEFQKQVQEELQNFDVEEFTQQYDVDEKLTEIFTQKYIEHKNLEFLEEINSIDSQSQLWVNTQEDKKTYSYAWLTYEIPDVAVNNNFSIINYQTGEKIEISKDEKETIQDHPEALKNLIDTKQKLEKLGLDFVWDNREEFLFLMKNDDKFNDTGKIETTDNDYLDISEFNHLLQFVLYKTTGDENTNDYYTNMSKIRQINGENELNEKRNFVSGLSNIWQKFVELWFLTESGTLNFHWVNTKNYSEITWPGFQKAA